MGRRKEERGRREEGKEVAYELPPTSKTQPLLSTTSPPFSGHIRPRPPVAPPPPPLVFASLMTRDTQASCGISQSPLEWGEPKADSGVCEMNANITVLSMG